MIEMSTLTFPGHEPYEIVDAKARVDIEDAIKRIDSLQRDVGAINVERNGWDEIEQDIADGYGADYYPVGSQVPIPWKRIATGGTETAYEPVSNVVHHGSVVFSMDDGETETEAPGMYIEWDKTIPDGFAFCQAQALQIFDGTEGAPDGLSAGKYAVFCTSFSNDWSAARPVYKEKYLVFTLTKAIPSGGVICGNAISNSASGWQFRTYTSCMLNKTTLETVNIEPSDTLPSDATYLGGTWGEESGYGKLNHIECLAYGDNTWETSDMRMWLNSDEADWWHKTTRYSMQHHMANTIRGFLTGYSADFKSHLKPIKCQQYVNTVKEGYGLSTTYDRIFIRSNSQANIITDNSAQYGAPYTEGETWGYYKKLADGQANLDSYGRFKIWATYPILISYALNAPTTAQYVFSRSARRSHAYGVFHVNAAGNCFNHNASNGYRCRPACVICGVSPDATQSGL